LKTSELPHQAGSVLDDAAGLLPPRSREGAR
jgi:hypothetical protein